MIKTISDEYVYKKEVDWSLFNYGFAIPIEHQVVFSQVAGRFIQRGESKDVNLYLNGKSYKAKLNNNRIDKKFGPHADIVQIRYTFSTSASWLFSEKLCIYKQNEAITRKRIKKTYSSSR